MTTEAVGLAQDLPAGRVMRAQIGDHDLAIWRSQSGNVQAWANRCPHRGMRLSYGFVRGESLACAYHGWHYNCDGNCHYIPAHPELEPPKTIVAQIFNVVEEQGLLWVSTEQTPEPAVLPASMVGVRSIAMQCSLNDASSAFRKAPPTDDANNTLIASEFSSQSNGLSFSDNKQADVVLVLFHQSDTTITAHILADEKYSPSGKRRLSRWSESVRRLAENRNTLSSTTS